MKCASCGHENPAGARFCANCGSALPRDSDPNASLVGQMIGGRYLVTRVIGEGGMGVVYEAEQRMGSEVRRVAVKTLLPALSKDPVIVSRFYRECGIVSQLDHPNTIKFYDFGQTPDGVLYISMEYVRGQPLTEVIEHSPLGIERVRHILRQVCGALQEAHSMGIVHRDLKPDNIVLTDRAGEMDFVKLLDFGIAARTSRARSSETKLTQEGMVLGTPPYMSPEQLTGGDIDGRSDIYSLGIIAYEMLAGHLPFEADSAWQYAQKHLLEPVPPLRTRGGTQPVSPEVERAIMHALAKNPNERPATALEFYAELARDGASVRASAQPPRTLDDMVAVPDARGTVPPSMYGPTTAAPSVPPFQPGPEVRPERTALAPAIVPEYTPAYRTGAAVSAAIPPPTLRPRKQRRLWVLVTGGLVGTAALGATVFAITYYLTSPPAPAPVQQPATSASVVEVTPLIEAAAPPPPPVQAPVSAESTQPPVTEPSRPPARKPTRPAPEPQLPAPPSANTPPPQTPPPQTPPPQTLPPTPPQTSPPQTQPTPPPAPQPQPEPPASGPAGDQACFAARSAADSGNIESAASLFRRCQATGGSTAAQVAARQRIRAQVGPEVRRRANVGNCAGARSAAAAAASIGASEGTTALGQTSCA